MRRLRAALIPALVGSLACRAPETHARQVDSMTVATSTLDTLPAASARGRMTLEEALARRRSVRAFTSDTLDERTIDQLLWAAQGVTSPEGLRTAPSAGALYPLEVYVARRDGLSHYRPREHRQERLSAHDSRPDLARAAYRQSAVVEAPAVFVITGVIARTAAKYDGRAERYVHLEAGHAAQNLLLQAVALGLGAVPIGAFDDQRVRDALRLPPGEEPLYLIPVGHPGG
ncbi:MAG TPA: SagB/ThcOx family dehydrogenase [Gemmatimonadaceae bacterium]